MKKNITFGIGGLIVGGAAGFLAGKLTYKKKLKMAEMDIETLLKEINRPEEDSEVSDEDDTKEEEATGAAGTDEESVKAEKGPGSWEGSSVNYEDFYAGHGYRSNYILKPDDSDADTRGIDPAERESPEDDEIDDYEDWDPDARPEFEPGSPEEREYRLRQELIESGMLIDESNENYEAGLEMTREMNSGKKPKLITEDSFYDEYLHHKKCILEYYTDTDSLVDTDIDDELDDQHRYVGDCLDKYGFRDNDMESIIYVRNFSYGIDYQISKVFGGWKG